MVDLAGIFNGGNAGFDPTVPALRAFSQVAEVNLQRQKLKQDAEFKLMDLDLKREELDLGADGKTALALGRKLRNIHDAEALSDYNIAQREELDFAQERANLHQAGTGSLYLRLNSSDDTIRKEAADEYLNLRDKYGESKSKNVQKQLEEMQQTVGAREREVRMSTNAAAVNEDRDATRQGVQNRFETTQQRNARLDEERKKRAEQDRQYKVAQSQISDLQKKRSAREAEKRQAELLAKPTRVKELESEISAIDSSISDLQKQMPVTPEEQASVLPPLLGEDSIPVIATPAEAAKLKPGTKYQTPNGRKFTR